MALLGPRDQIATDHTVVNVVTEIRDRCGSERRHESPRARHSPRRRESGERPRPSSSLGQSGSKSKQVDSTDVRPSSTHLDHHPRASVDQSLPSSSRASVDRRSLPEQHHHGRRDSVDKDQSGSSHVFRRDVELSPAVLEPPEKRTITVIQSPPRPAGDDDSAGVMGPADSAEVAELAEDQDSPGVDEPAVVEDSAGDADPAQEEDSAGVSR